MSEPSSGGSSPAGKPEDRLDSWKEIAGYLKRDVTTVQRWEKREGMPVHRHLHDKLGSVYAFRSELDGWTRGRNVATTSENEEAKPPLEPAGRSPGVEDGTEPVSDTRSAPRGTRGRFAFGWFLIVAALVAALLAGWRFVDRTEYFWRDPLADARFQNVTDSGTAEEAAAVSRDGKFVAFLSSRDGRTDVWVTQVGGGQSYNLTRGRFKGLGNPSLRVLGFSPDGALVTFWTRGVEGSDASRISVWAVPTLGGEPAPYLEGAAEFDWSSDGSRLVYHTTGPGDPTFVKDSTRQGQGQQIFAAAAGLHAHFPTWAPDRTFIYFVQGSVQPDVAWDIWRIRPTGGVAERITRHESLVSHPVFLNDRTLMYLAGDKDGAGPWLYSIDVERRVPHRVGAGPDRYTSLAASADGRRLVATLANPKGTLWRLVLGNTPVDASAATPISLTTRRGLSPRLGPGYLLYVSSRGIGDGIWKLADASTTELWSAPRTRIIGGPELSPDGQRVAFSAEERGKRLLYVMNADGTNARVVTESLDLTGAPAWTPDGQSITTAANVDGAPHLFRISLAGSAVPLVRDYARDPVWSPSGHFLVYSGADIGTAFPVKAITTTGSPYSFPNLTLTRGARRLRFVRGGRELVIMRGQIEHKDLWLIDLETGAERQLTDLPPDFNVLDFDISPDGRDVVLERMQEQSEIVLIDLTRSN